MTTEKLLEFVIPFDSNELLVTQSRSLGVSEKIEYAAGSDASSVLAELQDELDGRPLNVVKAANFNRLFGLIYSFKNLTNTTRRTLMEIISKGVCQMEDSASRFIRHPPESFKKSLISYRNSLKIFVYFFHWFHAQHEKHQSHDSPTEPMAKPKGKGSRGKGKGKTMSGDDPDYFSDSHKEAIVTTFIKILELDLNFLWSGSSIDDNFFNLYTKTISLFFSSSKNTSVSSLRQELIRLVVSIVSKFAGPAQLVLNEITELMYNHRHVCEPLYELIEELLRQDLSDSVSYVIKEVTKMNYPADANCLKNVSAFLSALSRVAPIEVTKHLDLLVRLLGNESYSLRNGVLKLLSSLIIDPISKEALSAKAKEKIYLLLLDRFYDSASYTRKQVLHAWTELCEAEAIPIRHYNEVARMAADRLKDKAAIVRESASRLLATLLSKNPFAPELKLSLWKQQLEKSTLELDQVTLKYETVLTSKQINSILGKPSSSSSSSSKGMSDRLEDDDDDDDDDEREEENDEDDLDDEEETDHVSAETVKELTQFSKALRFCEKVVEFIEILHDSEPLVCSLYGSENLTDIEQSINFFVVAKQFRIERAEDGIRKMLLLVWKNDPKIKTLVSAAYRNLFLGSSVTELKDPRLINLQMARNLIQLTVNASSAELASIEELIKEFVHDGSLTVSVLDALWALFSPKIDRVSQQQQQQQQQQTAQISRGALIILSMAAGADPKIVNNQKNLKLLVSQGLGPRWKSDESLAQYSCAMLQKSVFRPKSINTEPSEPFMRLDPSHKLFKKLSAVIVGSSKSLAKWFPAAEQAINTIYLLAQNPDKILSKLIKLMVSYLIDPAASKDSKNDRRSKHESAIDGDKSDANAEKKTGGEMKDDDEEEEKEEEDEEEEEIEVEDDQKKESSPHCSSIALSKFLFVVGHTALRQLMYIEEIQRELDRLRHLAASSSAATKKSSSKDDAMTDTLEEELGAGTAIDDSETEYLLHVVEKDVVCGNLLGSFAPLILAICKKPKEYPSHVLRSTAIIALCKFMCVSSQFCEANLSLLFSLLHQAEESWIRSDIVIALGDLCSRHPNSLDPWTKHLYRKLRDSDCTVRKNTLRVLSHLILNDMIKVKGQISEIACCIEDDNGQIAGLARLFFDQLNSKNKGNTRSDNIILSILPDIISNLSSGEGKVKSDTFRSIMSFLFGFIEKEDHFKNLVDKICQRFRSSPEEEQVENFAFCLTLVNYSEQSYKILSQKLNFYKDKLFNPTVYQYFTVILGKIKKNLKNELREEIELFEKKIEAHHKGEGETSPPDDLQEKEEKGSIPSRKKMVSSRAKPAATSRRGPKRTVTSKKAPPRKKKASLSDDDEDEDLVLESDSD